ncbi:MAG TPA: MBL fold metallo-hydrolase [Micromonosporaceae bacterium]|jgi:L-ascorbate metabolism protein UlaG (beta-lactamase superfamily)
MFHPAKVREDLEKARRTYGGRDWPATFADRLTSPLPGFTDVVKMLTSRRSPAPATIPQAPASSLPAMAPGQSAVTWVGHATYVVQIGGLTILTDPVWSTRIPGVRPRLAPPGIPLEAIGRIDAVVISHNHYDHLDTPTIRRLDRDTPMLVPGMLGGFFRQRDFRHVIELDWWESVSIGGVEFGFTPTHHWSRRGLYDSCKTLWGGWVFTTPEACVYFAGDTGYGKWFGEIAAHHPHIDVALLPIGAYEPNWFMKPVHMNPSEAVRACGDLGARRMATMHWGTFVLSAEPLLEPPALTRSAWLADGRSRDDLWDLAIGESRVF